MRNATCKSQNRGVGVVGSGRILHFALAFALVCAIALSTPALAAEGDKGLFEFQDGDRVVLLGGTFIERMQTDGYFETLVTAAYPKRNITFRNLGWSGDTVWGDSRAVFGTRADGFKRLVADVKLCEPTVIMVCYGANEAFAGEAGLGDFRAGLNTLLDSLEATGARIVLIGPRQHENLGPPLPDPAEYNADLKKYTKALAEVAGERGAWFVDLYAAGGSEENITSNGLHLKNDHAAHVVASEMCRRLGIQVGAMSEVTIDAATGDYDAQFVSIFDLKVSERELSMTAAARFPDDSIAINVLGWSSGKYEAKTNGRVTRRLSTSEDFQTLFVGGGAEDSLREAINAKNQLFFHRYRPQNETYLFLFRKHEQGNNAVEIPQFDPLIAELEAKIAKLKQPLKQKFELVKVD